jgi:hypothetical protein
MAGANVLSDEALAQVRDVVRQEAGRLRGDMPLPRPPIAPGPECFLAYSETGIDAATEESEVITAAYELCDLFRRNPDTDVIEPLYIGAEPNTRRVFNANTSAVPGGYFPVWRDKGGTWWAQATGSSIPRQRLRLGWVNADLTIPTTINSEDTVYVRPYVITGSWDGSAPFELLTMTAGSDNSLKCKSTGSYLMHLFYNCTFSIFTSTPTPTDCVLIQTQLLATSTGTSPIESAISRTTIPPTQPFTQSPRGFTGAATATLYAAKDDELRFVFTKSSGGLIAYNLSSFTARVWFVKLT